MVLGETGLTHAQLKPRGHFFEEFGDRRLNRQPLSVGPLLFLHSFNTIPLFVLALLLSRRFHLPHPYFAIVTISADF